jgi:hypothetical protein
MEKEIIIKPSFEFNVVFSANKHLWYSKISNKILIIFISFLLFIFILFTLFLLIFSTKTELNESYNSLINSGPTFLVLFLIPIIHYAIIYNNSKRLIKNYRLSENIEFIFNKDFFEEKGETFDIKHYWEKLYKVKECKSYFLIYQNKNLANIIPKTKITNNQYNELKELFNSLNIKKSLK